jgi:hypothetical protein
MKTIPFRASTVYLAIIAALAILTVAGFLNVVANATSEAAAGIVFSAGVFWWLFALAAVLQAIREAPRPVVIAIGASPDATAVAMRPAATGANQAAIMRRTSTSSTKGGP